jgi:competence protein ComEC
VYLWLGGSPPSLLRAYVMFMFWGVLLWRGRGRVLMDGLFQALVCMLVIQPGLVFDLGLQLSAGAVAGLALYLDCKPLLQAQANALQARLAAWFDVARFLDTDARRQRRLVRELEKDRRRDGPRAAQPNRFLASLPRLMLRVGIDLFCLSLAAQLAILPLIVWSFNQLSPQFYLNVLWLPFQGVLVQPLGMVGMCLLGFGPAVAGPFLAWAADLLDAGVWVLACLDDRNWLEPFIPLRPDWPAWIGYWTLLTWGLLLMRHNGVRRNAARPALALLPAIGLALLAWPTLEKTIEQAAGGVTLTLLDVGQGQSIVLEYPYGRRLLLDGGGLKSANFDVGASIVLPFLTLRSPPRLDLVALSHPDFDHSRGLLYLLRVADARAFASNGIPADSKEMRTLFATLERRRIPSQVLTAGQRIMLSPGLALEALHPPAGYAPENTNNGSLVLRLVWNGVGLALLPGDAGNSALDLILRRVVSGSSEGEELTAQALVLPHHGSGKELREDLYARVGPRLALASAGYRNQWGFPTQTVREALAARGVPLAVTAENGALTVRWSAPERFNFETARREPRDPLFSFE